MNGLLDGVGEVSPGMDGGRYREEQEITFVCVSPCQYSLPFFRDVFPDTSLGMD